MQIGADLREFVFRAASFPRGRIFFAEVLAQTFVRSPSGTLKRAGKVGANPNQAAGCILEQAQIGWNRNIGFDRF